MNPSQPVAGRARGRGRGLYSHPEPEHIKDPAFVSIWPHFHLGEKKTFCCILIVKCICAILLNFCLNRNRSLATS